MSIKKKIQQLREKPYRVRCTDCVYSRPFATIEEANVAANKHNRIGGKFEDHYIIITATTILK
jgi:hypothetical protein